MVYITSLKVRFNFARCSQQLRSTFVATSLNVRSNIARSSQQLHLKFTKYELRMLTYFLAYRIVEFKEKWGIPQCLVQWMAHIFLYRMRSNYSQTKLSRLEDFIKICGFYFRGCMWSPCLYKHTYIHHICNIIYILTILEYHNCV